MLPLRLARALLCAVLVAICALPAASANAAEPGLNLAAPYEAGSPISSYVDHSGARWSRNFISWAEAEPAPGQYNTRLLDALAQSVSTLRSHGIKPTFTVVLAPSWASGSADPSAPPADPAAYARFMAYLAGYPGLKNTVAAYELWNEEDSPLWWTGAPDPAAYTRLLQAAYPAIKAVDPNAAVLVGGLTGSDYAYMEQLYASGAQGFFDGVAVHSDVACGLVSPDSYYRDETGRISQYSFTGYREVHQTMLAHGDGDKSIYMTELGWSTSTKTCDQGVSKGKKDGGVSEDAQALYLAQAYACLAADPYVKMAAWFNTDDTAVADTPNSRFGLLRSNASQKPSAKAFKNVTSHAPKAIHCGGYVDTAAPKVAIAAPRSNQQFTTSLPITVSGADNQHLGRVAIFCDGVKIRNFVAGSKPKVKGSIDWQGAKKLALGPHVVTAVAIDAAMNQTTTTMNVVKVLPGQLAPVATTTTLKRGTVRGGITPVTVKVAARNSPVALTGKVTVIYSKNVHGRWKVAHKYTKPAKAAVTLKIRLQKGFTWRAQAVYAADAPFKASKSPARGVRG